LEPRWKREYSPFAASDVALGMLLKAETKKEGSLLLRVPPIAPARGC
jgi:hypothetical protein